MQPAGPFQSGGCVEPARRIGRSRRSIGRQHDQRPILGAPPRVLERVERHQQPAIVPDRRMICRSFKS